ncbi:hypothetical protein BSKO_00310 [Bryopsis sp. KO-2023]|nr:hypothetical protein BSKO_00310 [Bryopsis sp. KO-2023]
MPALHLKHTGPSRNPAATIATQNGRPQRMSRMHLDLGPSPSEFFVRYENLHSITVSAPSKLKLPNQLASNHKPPLTKTPTNRKKTRNYGKIFPNTEEKQGSQRNKTPPHKLTPPSRGPHPLSSSPSTHALLPPPAPTNPRQHRPLCPYHPQWPLGGPACRMVRLAPLLSFPSLFSLVSPLFSLLTPSSRRASDFSPTHTITGGKEAGGRLMPTLPPLKLVSIH